MPMIVVASENKCKVTAVSETAVQYQKLRDLQVIGIKVPTGVAEQPTTLEETFRGAKHRAEEAFRMNSESTYSFELV
ncbi:hypothetical protein CYMTET_48491 [Cymbomonas tetramitiformis]|uniref:inosine/xanthosine triphosphatase n=1 Tax=Cymbomonas tetramitiformis TaxID=36881 RepID=A0AAE0EUY4_9CHLO|nr:hypothetical protein CYMTET_48491 [Cymbomonas tetramitiformis]